MLLGLVPGTGYIRGSPGDREVESGKGFTFDYHMV